MILAKRLVASITIAATVFTMTPAPRMAWADEEETPVVAEGAVPEEQPEEQPLPIAEPEGDAEQTEPAEAAEDAQEAQELEEQATEEPEDAEEEKEANGIDAPIVVEATGDSAKDTKAIQDALDKALEANGATVHVVLKAGTYQLDAGLVIHSNTDLKLEDGAVVVRQNTAFNASLLTGGLSTWGGSSYGRVCNVTITGGTWDSNYKNNQSIFFFEQAHDVRIQNATLIHNRSDHVIILDGVRDSIISGCTLSDCISDGKYHASLRYVNEAIHIDSTLGKAPDNDHGHVDGVISTNVTVDGCVFDGVCTAVGTHYHGAGDPVQGTVTISNNTIKSVEPGCTIFTSANSTGWTIRNNTAVNTGANYFVRTNGTNNFRICDNTVDGIMCFAWENGSYHGFKSSGTFSGNKVTNITGSAFRSSSTASNYKFDHETYVTNISKVKNNNSTYCLIYVDTATVEMTNCTLRYDNTSISHGSGYLDTIRFERGLFTIKNNTVENAPFAGLYFKGAKAGTTVEGNTLKNCGRANNGNNCNAIMFFSSSNCSAKNNNLIDCGRGGIHLNGSSKNTITGNKIIYASGAYPVLLYNGSKNNTVTNNIFIGEKGYTKDASSKYNTVKDNKGVTFSGATSLPVGATATYSISDGTLKSSNTSVLAVSGKSVIGKKAGTAKLTLNCYGVTRTVNVTVYAVAGNKYEFRSALYTNLVLDIKSKSTNDGAKMISWTRNNGKNQQFQLESKGNQTFAIKCVHSEKYLDIMGGGTKEGQNVIQNTWNGSQTQLWKLTVDSKNQVTFTNVGSGLTLDIKGKRKARGTDIIHWSYNGGNNQKWILNKK